jgi:hypothetical protein
MSSAQSKTCNTFDLNNSINCILREFERRGIKFLGHSKGFDEMGNMMMTDDGYCYYVKWETMQYKNAAYEVNEYSQKELIKDGEPCRTFNQVAFSQFLLRDKEIRSILFASRESNVILQMPASKAWDLKIPLIQRYNKEPVYVFKDCDMLTFTYGDDFDDPKFLNRRHEKPPKPESETASPTEITPEEILEQDAKEFVEPSEPEEEEESEEPPEEPEPPKEESSLDDFMQSSMDSFMQKEDSDK